MKIIRATDMTETEQRYMRATPWILTGRCPCGQQIEVRVYGRKADLERITLKCKDCKP